MIYMKFIDIEIDFESLTRKNVVVVVDIELSFIVVVIDDCCCGVVVVSVC